MWIFDHNVRHLGSFRYFLAFPLRSQQQTQSKELHPMTTNLSTHAPHKLSTFQWQGLDSSKFHGGRFHENHPKDQLDSLLSQTTSKQILPQGKKTFPTKPSDSADPFKVQLRTFEAKYQKSTIFEIQNLHKLIKIPPKTQDTPTPQPPQQPHRNPYQNIGTSKIKALLHGEKQTGIYRNFYKSQARSSDALHTLH